MGCHFLLQGIFPTQGLNPGLLHCRQILYRLSYKGARVGLEKAMVCPRPITPPEDLREAAISARGHQRSHWKEAGEQDSSLPEASLGLTFQAALLSRSNERMLTQADSGQRPRRRGAPCVPPGQAAEHARDHSITACFSHGTEGTQHCVQEKTFTPTASSVVSLKIEGYVKRCMLCLIKRKSEVLSLFKEENSSSAML